jgi:inward rectifier potassium channel
MAPWQQSSAQGAPAPSVRLQKHGGIFTSVNPADWIRHWRYPNHLMLAVPWPIFFALIAVGYLLLHLMFASLYWLDAHGISGVAGPATSFMEAFFFSVHTLGAIGYGALYPSTLFTNLVVTLESLVGLILIALITGSTFSRFSKSYNELSTLMFRVANERRKTILDAGIRAYLAIDECTSEGQRMRRLHPMTLNRDCSPLFLLTWTVMHSIDQHSPLYGRTPQELSTSQADIVVSFSGIDEILDRPIHAHHNYPLSQVLFGHGFVDMMQEEDGEGQRFDFANFNRTHLCPSVEPS